MAEPNMPQMTYGGCTLHAE